MPKQFKDRKSGAILFLPTPDEKLIIDLQRKVAEQEELLNKLKPILDNPLLLKQLIPKEEIKRVPIIFE